jgi:hypothetical protein
MLPPPPAAFGASTSTGTHTRIAPGLGGIAVAAARGAVGSWPTAPGQVPVFSFLGSQGQSGQHAPNAMPGSPTLSGHIGHVSNGSAIVVNATAPVGLGSGVSSSSIGGAASNDSGDSGGSGSTYGGKPVFKVPRPAALSLARLRKGSSGSAKAPVAQRAAILFYVACVGVMGALQVRDEVSCISTAYTLGAGCAQ